LSAATTEVLADAAAVSNPAEALALLVAVLVLLLLLLLLALEAERQLVSVEELLTLKYPLYAMAPPYPDPVK